MATIRLCDWTKKKLSTNEKTFELVINGRKYEISADAMQEIQTRLDSDEVMPDRTVITKPLRSPTTTHSEDDIGVNVEAPSPFGGRSEPGLLDNLPVTPVQSVPPVPIPASTKERFQMPSASQTEAVLAESKRFKEGTLSALSPGKHRNLAAKRLADKEATFEDNKKQVPDVGRRGE